MAKDITYEEYQVRLDALKPRLENYADLLINFALRLRPGQELVLISPLEGADFAKLVVKTAYAAGAGHVTCRWIDTDIQRLMYENVSDDVIEHLPAWERELYNGLAEKGAAWLTLTGTDPDACRGLDMKRIAAAQKAKITQCAVWRQALDYGRCAWTIAGAPTQAWANKVFPQESPHIAYLKLWDAILDTARVSSQTHEDWETHTAMFNKAKRFLNNNHFDRVHYQASNGTDLYLGMLSDNTWEGGYMTGQEGLVFYPNVPTEEVYTTPDKYRTEGIVHSALPLVHSGSTVRDFWFKFKDGRVVDYDARVGKDVLTSILETDDGARYLGECALISKNTPIRESGLLFYNTLYDENASCHLALGRGFPECYAGDGDIRPDNLDSFGINTSAQHVDFMVGTDDLSITGIKKDGSEVPIFTNGEWSWE